MKESDVKYDGGRFYLVKSSDGKTWYNVDLNKLSCVCTGYKFYKKCKHLVMAQEFELKFNKLLGGNKAEKIKEHLEKVNRWVDSSELVDKGLYDDYAINTLKASFDIIEKKGSYHILK